MAYALYKNGRKIRKIKGNPRAASNQEDLVVWAPTKSGVKSWVKKWGTKKQKERFL
jgi:hypothetical protein